MQSMFDGDRQAILAFLQGNPFSQGYAPSSGEVTGILKQMGDEMGAGLREATAAEEKANRIYQELMAAKTKEVAALSKSIEEKLKLVGDLAVALAQMKNDLGDTEEALSADKEFLAGMEKACAAKKAEWEERVKTRADELAALADAIRMLNDDDALELFKKTLPTPGSSFMQVETTAVATRARALMAVRRVQWTSLSDHAQLDLIALALHGNKLGFEKVIKMIDDLVRSLRQ